jgi:hypothetical protein
MGNSAGSLFAGKPAQLPWDRCSFAGFIQNATMADFLDFNATRCSPVVLKD